MKNIVYNNQINNSSILGTIPKFSKQEEDHLLATFFEQLLLFDYVVISTDRNNFTLYFLIKKIGIDIVERLFRAGYIKLSIKSAIIVSGTGRQLENGTIDESVIYEQPPIVGGTLSDADLDLEKNIYQGLLPFRLDKKRIRQLTKVISPHYLRTDNMDLGVDTTQLVINSYKSNLLEYLNLPYEKEPEQLNLEERKKLQSLAHSILEMGIISKNSFKSYENYGSFEIAQNIYSNIGKAFKISENTAEILSIENTPDLQQIFLQNNFDISDIFKLRHLKTAKFFRKWINEVGENENSAEVTEAYLAEIKEAKSFFNTAKGKIIKNTVLFGASTGLGTLIAGPLGTVVGASATPLVNLGIDYGLSLLEEFTTEGIFAGKNPKIFIDNLKEEVKKTDT
ncbi:hypothetical protein [Frigoriflavimonas asaccharolytica]|uniref:Uncharacterized protein n=1 Tax=Frigoriflavimonas asaccharolytica TaxID=2735899 RepID=A0A8J8K7L5_9FLAO|nr:hypothetical protein [Frigoriflavimonas asaccharolytica]NRS91606.1 hypothetical protein [Frigoriflavimonas asaccharolytica]